MQMTISTRRMLLTEAAKSELAHLRSISYSPKFGERLRKEALEWNLQDDQSFHFGAYFNNSLISTLRLTYVQNAELFETLMQVPISSSFAHLPCWVIGRLATDPAFKGQSINMQLRNEAYKFILERHRPETGEKFIFGTALKTAVRLSYLESLGYEVRSGEKKWEGYIEAEPHEVAIFRIEIAKLKTVI